MYESEGGVSDAARYLIQEIVWLLEGDEGILAEVARKYFNSGDNEAFDRWRNSLPVSDRYHLGLMTPIQGFPMDKA